ncbi:MAG: acyltransferase family protein [Syntrophobacteraceae bacterium]
MLRGLSILYIVGFWHVMNYVPPSQAYHNSITCRIIVGILGTFVFVSGYLLGRTRINATSSGIVSFYSKRILRIYPLYLCAILLFFVFRISDGTTLLKASMLISMFYGPSPPTLWFITMIIAYYAIAPLLIILITHKICFWLCSAAILASAIIMTIWSSHVDPRIAIYLPAFVSGIYFANIRALKPVPTIYFAVIGLVCSIAISFLFSSSSSPESSLASIPIATFGPMCIFLLSLCYEKSIPNWKAFSVLGYSGYVMYLVHRPVYGTMDLLLYHIYNVVSTTWHLIYLIGVCLPMIIIVSWYIQLYYDKVMQLCLTYVNDKTCHVGE